MYNVGSRSAFDDLLSILSRCTIGGNERHYSFDNQYQQSVPTTNAAYRALHVWLFPFMLTDSIMTCALRKESPPNSHISSLRFFTINVQHAPTSPGLSCISCNQKDDSSDAPLPKTCGHICKGWWMRHNSVVQVDGYIKIAHTFLSQFSDAHIPCSYVSGQEYDSGVPGSPGTKHIKM
jgi:hypothetical protein